MSKFVWNSNKHLVSKASMLPQIEFGGLHMISKKFVGSTAHIIFIKRWCNDIKAKWKALTEFLMGLNVSEIFYTCTKTAYYKTLVLV